MATPLSYVLLVMVGESSTAREPKRDSGETPQNAPNKANTPTLTVPQRLAFLAFVIFVIMAILADSTNKKAIVQPDELEQLRKFTIFLFAALLPSDALIRFGRNLLFRTLPNAEDAAHTAPTTTNAQYLAFGTFIVMVALTLLSTKLVSADEFAQVNEVARTLVVALLPSEAVLRFARSLYYASPTTPQPNNTALRLV